MKKIDSTEIINMRKNGLTYKQICDKTGLSKGTVSKYCRGINENFLIYESIIKMDPDIIKNSQKLYDEGNSLRYVGKKIGVSRQTLAKYLKVRPKKWKDDDVLRKDNIERVKRWKRKLKEEFVSMKGGECINCGYKKSLRSLHFHHIDPSKKDITISHNSMTKEKAIEELDKCVLVCSNCHGEIHDGLIDLSVCLKGLGT